MKNIYTYFGDRDNEYCHLIESKDSLCVGGKVIPQSQIVCAEQVHKDKVHRCSASDSGAGFFGKAKIASADALITDIPGQYLMIRTADCFPILLFDPQGKAVAAVHSGREGTRLNILGKTLDIMVNDYGCQPADLVAHIGAGICEKHYQVDEATYDEFAKTIVKDGFKLLGEHCYLNLRAVIFQQLLRAGLRFYNIENIHSCTFEDESYLSYRRDKSAKRQINLIGIIDE